MGRCPLSIVCSRGTPPKATWNSNSHGARPVPVIITVIKWIRTSRLSIKTSLSQVLDDMQHGGVGELVIVVVMLFVGTSPSRFSLVSHSHQSLISH